MKLRCLHGYFIFEETAIGQVADFMGYTGFELVPKDGYFTFASLAEAPVFSLAGAPLLLGTPATVTFEGRPWEVFKANGVIYDFTTDTLVPIASVIQKTEIKEAGNRYWSPGLILPGTITEDGKVQDFAGFFSRDKLRWLYSEVTYV